MLRPAAYLALLLTTSMNAGCIAPGLVPPQAVATAPEAVQAPVAVPSPVPATPPSATAAAAEPPAARSAATWEMPWQISPVAYAAGGVRERVVAIDLPRTGRVRGTPSALATIGRPLVGARGPNRTVRICRDTVAKGAEKFGPKEVEAASAGRERRNALGQYVAPVRIRITYAREGAYEVRTSTLTCIVDRRGAIVDAYVGRPRSTRSAASGGAVTRRPG